MGKSYNSNQDKTGKFARERAMREQKRSKSKGSGKSRTPIGNDSNGDNGHIPRYNDGDFGDGEN